VAVPNVTAIDCKQADVYGPSFEQKGGMSFTVKRLVPPFHVAAQPYPASRWRSKITARSFLHNSDGAQLVPSINATPAT